MKILQINNYNYLKGGSERVYQNTIELLQKQGHEVYFFSVADPRNNNLCAGVAVDVVSWRERKGFFNKLKGAKDFIYNKKVAKALDNCIKEFNPDVAHLHIYYGALSNSVVSILRKHKIPIVQTVHEFRLLCPAYTCLDSKLNICERCAGKTFGFECVKKRCIKSSLPYSMLAALECFIRDTFYNNQKNISAFIMVSQFIQKKHLQYYPNMANKCYQLYNSLETELYKKYVENPERKESYYFYFGRLSPEKGVFTLLNVFIENPQLNLKIAGTGPDEEKLRKFVVSRNAKNIDFLGFINGAELFTYIAKARYVIVPSEWYENNPLSIIESFALGTPVIGSDIGGICELIDDSINGFLFKHNDLTSLNESLIKSVKINSLEYQEQCKQALKMAVEKFDNKKYYNSLDLIYRKIK